MHTKKHSDNSNLPASYTTRCDVLYFCHWRCSSLWLSQWVSPSFSFSTASFYKRYKSTGFVYNLENGNGKYCGLAVKALLIVKQIIVAITSNILLLWISIRISYFHPCPWSSSEPSFLPRSIYNIWTMCRK